MKYIITGVDNVKGDSTSDSNSLNEYFELGWEIMSTHLKVKELLYDKTISENDTIVTCQGREFLYKKTFNNVITWNQYKKNRSDNEINLVKFFTDNHSNLDSLGLKNDVNLINLYCDLQHKDDVYSKYNLEKKFICLVYRERNHDSHRNIDKNFMKDLVKFLIYEKNVSIFVVGYGGEFLCDNKNSFFVSLHEFATLINHKNCSLCISTLTGPPHLTYLFGHDKLQNIILDLEKHRELEHIKNHPLAMGDKFNYKKINTHFINGMIDLTNIKTIINQKMRYE